MTGIIAFSDFHAHLWAEFATPLDNVYVNTRFEEQVEVLETVLTHAQETGRSVIFAGDLFHKRVNVNTAVFNAIFNKFREYGDVPVLMVRGNHDSMNNSLYSNHSLKPFEALSNVVVVATPQVVDFAGSKVSCLPYGDEIDIMKKFLSSPDTQSADILVAHIGIEGAKESSGHSLEGAFTLSDLYSENYNHVILGHYHKHQFLNDNTFYVGNTLPTSFSDVDDKGVMMLDTKTPVKAVFRHIPSKKFLTLSPSDITSDNAEEILTDNYVRLRASKQEVSSMTALPEDIPHTVRIEVQDVVSTDTRIDISVDDTPTKIVGAYYDEYLSDNSDLCKSIVLGYINKAQQEGEA